MDPLVFGLVLASAFMHAGWNTLIKSGGAPLIRLAITNGVAALVMLPVGLVLGFPDPASWPFLVASMFVHLFYYLLLALWVLARHGREVPEFVKHHWFQGIASGVMYTASYGIVVWAMSSTPMTYVSALRETSVIVAAILGTRLLKEPLGGRRIFAACLVAFGVAMLQRTSPPRKNRKHNLPVRPLTTD